jgi:hypothetical protein
MSFLQHIQRVLAGLVLLGWTLLASAGEIWLIAHHDAAVASLDRAAAADIFLGRHAPGSRLQPFDRDDPALRADFYRALADLSPQSVRAHWAKLVFTGRGRPPAIVGAAQIAPLLEKQPDAITYMPAGDLPTGARILLKLQTGVPE